MKIAAVDGADFETRSPHFLDDDVDHTLFCLNLTRYTEKGCCFDEDGVRFEVLGPNDDIHESRLILHGHESNSRRSAGALATDDHAGVVDSPAAFHCRNGLCVWKTQRQKFSSEWGQEVSMSAV